MKLKRYMYNDFKVLNNKFNYIPVQISSISFLNYARFDLKTK